MGQGAAEIAAAERARSGRIAVVSLGLIAYQMVRPAAEPRYPQAAGRPVSVQTRGP
ncbi:hypothetical protein FAIPA1_230020 [Frankia sp. AiPs1]